MKTGATIIGIVSVPIYFFIPLLLLAWNFRDDDTLTWLWVFGGWVLLFPLFMLSIFGGLATYGLFSWRLRHPYDARRLLVIITLVVVGAVLAWRLLQWGDGYGPGLPILIFYEGPNPNYAFLTNRYGFYVPYGIPRIFGFLFGIVLPLCLFVAAACFAFGRLMRRELSRIVRYATNTRRAS
jgi:hypothetical protein